MFKKLVLSTRLRRRVSWVIALVLIFPFILFFHATGRAPAKGPGGTAGIIFGTPIPWERFEQQWRWMRYRLEDQQPERAETPRPLLNQLTWDRLILLEEARRRKLRVDGRELAAGIQQTPGFRDQGRFVPERYYTYLRAIGTTPQTFERLLRDDLLIEKLMSTAKASGSEGEAQARAEEWLQELRERAKVQSFVGEEGTDVSGAGR